MNLLETTLIEIESIRYTIQVPVMKHKKIVTKLYDNSSKITNNIYEDNYFIKVTVPTIACRTTELEKNYSTY